MTFSFYHLTVERARAFGVRRLAAAFHLALSVAIASAADPATNAPSSTTTNTGTVMTNQLPQSTTNVITNVITNVSTNITATASTNASNNTATTDSTVSTKDLAGFDEFKIITQRNIFDPNRRPPRRPGSGSEDQPKPRRIDYLNLVGAMSYEKGRFAFFDGSSSEYRKSVKPGDNIAGYKVANVTQNNVTLESGDKKIQLPVGGQLKREDEGEWRVNSNPENFAASTNSSGSSSSSSSVSTSSSSSNSTSSSSTDEQNPILKRLLEQRRQGK
jgi:hypothetical protein